MERRRGAELEAALLDAAWEQLSAEGYGGFSFDAIAERAGTSKPVLYRRWPTHEALLLATLKHQRLIQRLEIPDTGSLREDVLALLRSSSLLNKAFIAVFSVRMGAYFEETGKSPANLREAILGERPPAMKTIIARAIERGEISDTNLPDRVINLPFDLLRNEAMMTLEQIPDEVILEIVDRIFMPLVTHH